MEDAIKSMILVIQNVIITKVLSIILGICQGLNQL